MTGDVLWNLAAVLVGLAMTCSGVKAMAERYLKGTK